MMGFSREELINKLTTLGTATI